MLLINVLNKCFPEFLLRIYFYTWCFILFVSLCHQISGTSSNSGLCFNHSKSCSQQILAQLGPEAANVTNETCNMIYHSKLSPVCKSMSILEGEKDEEEEYGKMLLNAFIYREGHMKYNTAVNVSFYNIKWKKIYMRFIENQVQTPSLCREFQVIPEISSSFTIYFDCLWSTDVEQKAFHFEYQAFTPLGQSFTYKYFFLVPNGEQIDDNTPLKNWTIFMVVDVTSMPERLVLRLQVAPKRLGIRGYRVQVEKTLKNNPWVVKSIDLFPEPDQVELKFPFDTGSRFGKYVFRATPLHDNCTSKNPCTISETPPILIVEMAEPKFLTGVVFLVIFIPILLMGYFIWKRNCDTAKEPTTPPGPPKLLIMYSSASVLHVKKMIKLAEYLRKVCGVHALIDELGIPESLTKDPLKWYIEAFNEADYVAIFASPDSTVPEKEEARRYSRYQHKEQIAHNQLSYRLCSTETKCKFFSVGIPGTNWDTLPGEAAALTRYIFPRDLDPVLILVGSSCQCDRGAGFYHALELASKDDEPKLPPSVNPPPPPEVTKQAEEEDDGRTSPCCNTQSASELELVSSRQFLSDTDDSNPSIDHLSLLGES